MTKENFDWSPLKNESIAIAKQNAIAIYISTAGSGVIRQQRDPDQTSDSSVTFAIEQLPVIIDRLEELYIAAFSDLA